jgi:hypothetical protein
MITHITSSFPLNFAVRGRLYTASRRGTDYAILEVRNPTILAALGSTPSKLVVSRYRSGCDWTVKLSIEWSFRFIHFRIIHTSWLHPRMLTVSEFSSSISTSPARLHLVRSLVLHCLASLILPGSKNTSSSSFESVYSVLCQVRVLTSSEFGSSHPFLASHIFIGSEALSLQSCISWALEVAFWMRSGWELSVHQSV